MERIIKKRVIKHLVGHSFVDQILGPAYDGITEEYVTILEQLSMNADHESIKYYQGQLQGLRRAIEILRSIARKASQAGDEPEEEITK